MLSKWARWSAPVAGLLAFSLYVVYLARNDLSSLPGGWKTLAVPLFLGLLSAIAISLRSAISRPLSIRLWLASHISLLAISGLTLFALALRVFGISDNLPYLNHPDEPAVADRAIKILQTGDYNPHYFVYPNLYTYMQAAVYVLRFFSLVSSGAISNLNQIAPADFYLWGRLLTALLGTLTVPLVYLAARRLYGVTIALIAATFMAASNLHILHSQFITTDVPATFFTALALFTIVRLLPADTHNSPKHISPVPHLPPVTRYMAAGVAIGLAIGTKYNSALVIVPFLLAHFYVTQSAPGARLRSFFSPRLWTALAAMLLAFFATTPFAIFDLPSFLNELASVVAHYRSGHPGHESDANWRFYFSAFLKTDFLPTLLALVGVILAFARHRRTDILLLSFPVVFYLSMSSYRVNFERNMLPILPFTSILAAIPLVLAYDLIRQRISDAAPDTSRVRIGGAIQVLLPVLVVLMVLPATVDAARRGYRQSQPDTRVRAAQWLDTNARPGSKLWLESPGPILDTTRYLVVQGSHVTEHPIEWYQANRYDYLVLSSVAYKDITYGNPSRDPSMQAAYLRFFDEAVPYLAASFDSNPIDTPGPTILVYRTGYTPPRSAADVHPQHPINAIYREEGDGAGTAHLIGADFPTTATPGKPIPLVLYWTSNPPLREDYTVFVHLIDPAGERPAQRDTAPRANTYPTSLWQPGEIIVDEQTLDLPATLPPGTYTLRVGLYLQSNFHSLPVSSSTGVPLPNQGKDYVVLGEITVQP